MVKAMLLVVCAMLASVAMAQQSKPNLVFMLVDDWGWANVGYHRDPPTIKGGRHSKH
jgi:arylsulfatase I/J